jgi:hypothetical protein
VLPCGEVAPFYNLAGNLCTRPTDNVQALSIVCCVPELHDRPRVWARPDDTLHKMTHNNAST